MNRKIVALIVALAAALGISLVALPSPAQAYSWSGQRCANTTYGGQICAQVHTIAYQNGLKVDQIQLCAYQRPNTGPQGETQNVFRGSGNSGAEFFGGTGVNLGPEFWPALNDANVGTCAYTTWLSPKMGNKSCYRITGSARNAFPYPDDSFTIRGGNLGGAYDCG